MDLLTIKGVKKSKAFSHQSAQLFCNLCLGSLLFAKYSDTIVFGVLSSMSALYNKKCEELAKYTKEYKSFNAVNDDIKKDIIKYGGILDLKSVENIFVYYIFLDGKGYLSYKRDLPKNKLSTDVLCEEAIYKAIALNRHGVCCHKAPTLADIMNDVNYEADVIVGNLQEGKINYDIKPFEIGDVFSEEEIEQFKEELKYVKDDELDNIIKDVIDKKMKNMNNIGENKRESLPSNHVITQVNDDKYTYFLDPERAQIFIKQENKEKKFVSYTGELFTMTELNEDTKWNQTLNEKAFKSVVDISNNIEKTEKHLKNNLDVLEDFYREVQPKLVEAEDIYQLILKS